MRTSSTTYVPAVALTVAAAALGCADWDNPTALADLEPEVEFEIGATEIQTLEEVEVHVDVRDGGLRMELTHSELEIQHADGSEPRVVSMEPAGEGYAAHVTFFEPGEHHIHFRGMPSRHRLIGDLGEIEVDVVRRHESVGPYWIELETSPHGPILEGQASHIHVHVFAVNADGTSGAPVGGLDLHLELHSPAGVEQALTVAEEEAGDYEGEYTFGAAGLYELHVEIEVGTEEVSAEFHIPVSSLDADEPETQDEPGGDGHDHG